MDAIYRDKSLGEIPWHLEEPPARLLELVNSGSVPVGDAVDLGCGAGTAAVWLATQGYTVTGLDLSPQATRLATKRAEKKGVACRFQARDLTTPVEGLEGAFDFAYDWEVLHHVFPADRQVYVQNVHRMLRSGGQYYSVCFSEEDSLGIGGQEKYRETALGTVLYFSSEHELRELFSAHFQVETLQTIPVAGKFTPHLAVEVLMTKK